jgi:Holliday junction resolvase RusA-like endonuclease
MTFFKAQKPQATSISFTVLGHPEPQGSTRAFLMAGRPRVTSDNAKMKPWRQQVGWTALRARPGAQIFAAQHIPVKARFEFYLAPPIKMPKGRSWPAVKPDLDKLCRATFDALTGILWIDDGQVVDLAAVKQYGLPERTEITVEIAA